MHRAFGFSWKWAVWLVIGWRFTSYSLNYIGFISFWLNFLLLKWSSSFCSGTSVILFGILQIVEMGFSHCIVCYFMEPLDKHSNKKRRILWLLVIFQGTPCDSQPLTTNKRLANYLSHAIRKVYTSKIFLSSFFPSRCKTNGVALIYTEHNHTWSSMENSAKKYYIGRKCSQLSGRIEKLMG